MGKKLFYGAGLFNFVCANPGALPYAFSKRIPSPSERAACIVWLFFCSLFPFAFVRNLWYNIIILEEVVSFIGSVAEERKETVYAGEW